MVRVVLEGKQGGERLCSAAFTARVIVRERVRVPAGGGDSKEGNSTNGEETFQRMRSTRRSLLPVTHLCCLPAGTFPWSSGGFHIACSKNNNDYKNNNNQ